MSVVTWNQLSRLHWAPDRSTCIRSQQYLPTVHGVAVDLLLDKLLRSSVARIFEGRLDPKRTVDRDVIWCREMCHLEPRCSVPITRWAHEGRIFCWRGWGQDQSSGDPSAVPNTTKRQDQYPEMPRVFEHRYYRVDLGCEGGPERSAGSSLFISVLIFGYLLDGTGTTKCIHFDFCRRSSERSSNLTAHPAENSPAFSFSFNPRTWSGSNPGGEFICRFLRFGGVGSNAVSSDRPPGNSNDTQSARHSEWVSADFR